MAIWLAVAAFAGLVVAAVIARWLARRVQSANRALLRTQQDANARVARIDEERAMREAILSSLEEGLALFGSDGAVLYQNHQAERLLGGPIRSAQHLAPAGLRSVVEAAAQARP